MGQTYKNDLNQQLATVSMTANASSKLLKQKPKQINKEQKKSAQSGFDFKTF